MKKGGAFTIEILPKIEILPCQNGFFWPKKDRDFSQKIENSTNLKFFPDDFKISLENRDKTLFSEIFNEKNRDFY